MSIIVAVEKDGAVAMASDTQDNLGDNTVPTSMHRAQKVRRVAGALLGCAGWSLYHNLLDDFLPRHKKVSLADEKAIFGFFLDFWQALREEYSLVEPQPGGADDPTPFGELDSDFLVANGKGLYHVSSQIAVARFQKFFAVGSGSDFAMGALHALYESDLDAETLARRAVETAMAFRVDCGGDVDLQTLKG